MKSSSQHRLENSLCAQFLKKQKNKYLLWDQKKATMNEQKKEKYFNDLVKIQKET